MKKGRIGLWIFCIILSAGLLFADYAKDNIVIPEKTPIYLYAPEDMTAAFQRAVLVGDLSSTHKLITTKDIEKANIVVGTVKEDDPEYEKFAYSPFIVGYYEKDSYADKLKKSGLLSESIYNESSDYLEIDFLQAVNAVIKGESWEKFGLDGIGKVKIFYPDKSTIYWTDFYDFMLVTVNNGKYPKTDEEMKKAVQTIEAFEKSEYTEALINFDEKLERLGGFTKDVFWILPEKLISDLAYGNYHTNLLYPKTTVYMNYYIKYDEVGKKLKPYYNLTGFIGENFYAKLNGSLYRTPEDSVLGNISDYVYYERDTYNVLILDKNRIKPVSNST